MQTRQTGSAARVTTAEKPFHTLPGATHFSAADLSSWTVAQRRYRRLVHDRHPDRHPDESSHAEFIEITQAFMQLRRQYRATGRLLAGPGPGAATAITADFAPRRSTAASTKDSSDTDLPWRDPRRVPDRRPARRRLLFATCGIGVAVLLMLVLVALDRQAQSVRQERAREAQGALEITFPDIVQPASPHRHRRTDPRVTG